MNDKGAVVYTPYEDFAFEVRKRVVSRRMMRFNFCLNSIILSTLLRTGHQKERPCVTQFQLSRSEMMVIQTSAESAELVGNDQLYFRMTSQPQNQRICQITL